MKLARHVRKIFLLLFLLAASISTVMGAEAGVLKVGVAKIDSTPTDLTGLTNQWLTRFAGVHDHLYVRALVLDNGVNSAAIVSVDLMEFFDTSTLRERIAKEVGISADHLILTATNDYSAPRAGGVNQASLAQKNATGSVAYYQKLYDQIVEALRQAKATEQPARMGIGTGASYVNINRDEYTAKGWIQGINPNGISDRTVWVVKFETLSGDPIGVLFNYGVHSVVAGPQSDQLTGDLAGAAERYVEQHYKDKAVALFTIGPAGDQNPAFIGPSQQPQEAMPIFATIDAEGLMLGAEVVRMANRIQSATTTARIEAAEKEFTCARRARQQGFQSGQDPLKLQAQGAAGQSPAQGQPQGAGQAPPQAPPPPRHPESPEIKVRLGLILLNDIAFTSVSGEAVTNVYWRLKKTSPLANTILITMANDSVGYIVDDASYDTPNFEASKTPLVRGCAEDALIDGLVGMINQYK
jgi:hypothetical protein